jgi:hypothetical protein
VAMMFCQLAQAKSLREISDGLACCEGRLNHMGLQEGPKRSTLSYANAKRPWQLFEEVFYDQLGLAQSLAPKKKLRFKNKFLSLDASVIDLCLSMYNWATFRQTKGAVAFYPRKQVLPHLVSNLLGVAEAVAWENKRASRRTRGVEPDEVELSVRAEATARRRFKKLLDIYRGKRM